MRLKTQFDLGHISFPAKSEVETLVKSFASYCEGWVPRYEDIDWTDLKYSKEDFSKIMYIDSELWKQELLSHEELFAKIYDKLPKEFFFMRVLLLSALWRSPEKWGLEPEVAYEY
jgi:hypothetical protein